MKQFTIGNITFTAEGVCTNMIPYSTEQHPLKRQDGAKFLFDVRELILHRIQHCSEELEANLHKATYVSDQVIVWEGGHFSVPTFTMMVEWLENDSTNVPQGIVQQVLRQMFEEQNFYNKDLYYYLTEAILFEE